MSQGGTSLSVSPTSTNAELASDLCGSIVTSDTLTPTAGQTVVLADTVVNNIQALGGRLGGGAGATTMSYSLSFGQDAALVAATFAHA